MGTAIHRFPCGKCGADVEYAPGVGLQCPFCGHGPGEPRNADQVIEELDFSTYLERSEKGFAAPESQQVKCQGCGATAEVAADAMSAACAFCGSPVVVEPHGEDVIRPEGVVPFKVGKQEVVDRFKKWVGGLWFAPNALKKLARNDQVQGVYRPHFTFDAHTISFYQGERGEHYQATESYTDAQGKSQTRKVQKTRWQPASGRVAKFFDDVLVAAGRPLDWSSDYDMKELKPYDPGFLAGWLAERYTRTPELAWPDARAIMDRIIEGLCREDIGGDEQRVSSVKTAVDAIKWKHILLPLYLSSYEYGGKVFRFQCNGQTGQVRGERPYSVVKIVLFVLALLLAAGGALYLLG